MYLSLIVVMPYKCVAPGCISGYVNNDNPNIVLFQFPDERTYPQQRALWISKVPRANWQANKKRNLYLCEKHFHPDDIRSNSVDKRRKRATPLKRKRLKDGVVPTIWPNLPDYLSPPPVSARPTSIATSEARQKKQEKTNESFLLQEKLKDEFTSLEDLQNKLDMSLLPSEVRNVVNTDSLFFFKLCLVDHPLILYGIKIDYNLIKSDRFDLDERCNI